MKFDGTWNSRKFRIIKNINKKAMEQQFEEVLFQMELVDGTIVDVIDMSGVGPPTTSGEDY